MSVSVKLKRSKACRGVVWDQKISSKPKWRQVPRDEARFLCVAFYRIQGLFYSLYPLLCCGRVELSVNQHTHSLDGGVDVFHAEDRRLVDQTLSLVRERVRHIQRICNYDFQFDYTWTQTLKFD